jgi:CDP-glucose 4,6-dehydratase
VNVGGTVNLLEACRSTASVAAIVVVTSDKCYENRGDGRPHREGDPLGGHDPYSASKAAAEIVAASWRASYFADGPPMATVRAGNVIGSGDWPADRLVPDFVRAATGVAPLRIRNPAAVRPWQDVLDCLAGYLLVAERLRAGDNGASRAWNFGPSPEAARDVGSVVARLVELWPNTVAWRADDGPNPPEAPLLMLDSTDARTLLGWRPRSSLDESLADLVAWHVSHAAGEDVLPLCEKLLDRRSERA